MTPTPATDLTQTRPETGMHPSDVGSDFDIALQDVESSVEDITSQGPRSTCLMHDRTCDSMSDEHHRRILTELEHDVQEMERAPHRREDAQVQHDEGGTYPVLHTFSPSVNDPIYRQAEVNTQPSAYPRSFPGLLQANVTADRLATNLARQQQLPTLRNVTIVPNADTIALQNSYRHNTNQQTEMARFQDLVSEFSIGCQQHSGVSPHVSIAFMIKLALERVKIVQLQHIEPVVGRFSYNDDAFTDRVPRFEDKLLTVLQVGLVRQELRGGMHDNADGRTMLDIYGSCLLEAQVWQLEILRSWNAQLEYHIGRCLA